MLVLWHTTLERLSRSHVLIRVHTVDAAGDSERIAMRCVFFLYTNRVGVANYFQLFHETRAAARFLVSLCAAASAVLQRDPSLLDDTTVYDLLPTRFVCVSDTDDY